MNGYQTSTSGWSVGRARVPGRSRSIIPFVGPVMDSDMSVQALRDRFVGETAWIVGKGPSLVMLGRADIGNGPVIAINEAILAVEALCLSNPVFSMQKDADEYDTVPTLAVRREGTSFIPVRDATLLVHAHESPNRMPDHSPRFVFDNDADFGLEWWEFSMIVGIAIARLMGCVQVVLVSLDGCLHEDYRTCTPRPDGSFLVEVEDEGTSPEYSGHRTRIDAYLARIGMPVRWLTPGHARPEVERLEQVLAERQAEVDRLAARVAERDLMLRQVTVEAARLAAVVDEKADELQKTAAELDAARSRVAELLGSASWRWTAPLRHVADALLRLRRGR